MSTTLDRPVYTINPGKSAIVAAHQAGLHRGRQAALQSACTACARVKA